MSSSVLERANSWALSSSISRSVSTRLVMSRRMLKRRTDPSVPWRRRLVVSSSTKRPSPRRRQRHADRGPRAVALGPYQLPARVVGVDEVLVRQGAELLGRHGEHGAGRGVGGGDAPVGRREEHAVDGVLEHGAVGGGPYRVGVLHRQCVFLHRAPVAQRGDRSVGRWYPTGSRQWRFSGEGVTFGLVGARPRTAERSPVTPQSSSPSGSSSSKASSSPASLLPGAVF